MSYEISGILVEKKAVQKISEVFSKREFTIEHKETSQNGEVYKSFATFELSTANLSKIDNIEAGQPIKVKFNIRGRKWEKDGAVRYFNSLEAWSISVDKDYK